MSVVFYAIDDSEVHRHGVVHSIETLRDHNREIPVRVVLFGPRPPAELSRRVEALGAELVARAPCEDVPNAWFLKWAALSEIEEESALFVDADTAFFGDPVTIFEECADYQFVAREEVGARVGVGVHFVGSQVIEPKVDESAHARLCAALDLAELPYFNTGVMAFREGAAARLARAVPQIPHLRRKLNRGELPYPWAIYHAADCVVGSLLVATEGLRSGFLGPRLAPFYTELRAGTVEDPGVVLHTFGPLYPFYVAEFLGRDALDSYPGPRNYTLDFDPR